MISRATAAALGLTLCAGLHAEICPHNRAEVQALRDSLEVARANLLASKDNFGPARATTIDATGSAIAALERAAGGAIAPDPKAKAAHTPGGHLHPHMRRAQEALWESKRSLERLQCLAPDQSSAINKAIERALAGIDEAFTFNPPGSGR